MVTISIRNRWQSINTCALFCPEIGNTWNADENYTLSKI